MSEAGQRARRLTYSQVLNHSFMQTENPHGAGQRNETPLGPQITPPHPLGLEQEHALFQISFPRASVAVQHKVGARGGSQRQARDPNIPLEENSPEF